MRRNTRRLIWTLLTALVVAGLGGAPANAAEGKVNINEAGVEQLALLPRVGPSVAQRIVEFRDKNGAFKAIADLMLVRGIGEKTFEGLAPYVTLKGETTLSEKVSAGRQESEGDERR